MADYLTFANVVIDSDLTNALADIGGFALSGCVYAKGKLYVPDLTQYQLDVIKAKVDPVVARAAIAKEAGRFISTMDFVKRYTVDEQIAIVTAAKTDVQVQLLLLTLQTWTAPIDLDSPEVASGLAYLTSTGILAAGRAAAIKAH